MGEVAKILDVCCGSRMMWFNRTDPRAIFGDCRAETLSVIDRSYHRYVVIGPDVRMDFRALPFRDASFRLVVFDPPHLLHAGPRSWLAAKYGKLGGDWKSDLRQGFMECFRVLESFGILIFKWSEIQIPVSKILPLAPCKPLFGNRRVGQSKTHWLVFMNSEVRRG